MGWGGGEEDIPVISKHGEHVNVMEFPVTMATKSVSHIRSKYLGTLQKCNCKGLTKRSFTNTTHTQVAVVLYLVFLCKLLCHKNLKSYLTKAVPMSGHSYRSGGLTQTPCLEISKEK